MHFNVRFPRGGSELSDTVAWVHFDVPSPFSPVISEATVACERVRTLARREQQYDVVISDAMFAYPIYAMVTVSAPREDLDRWLARVVVAISGPLADGGLTELEVTEPGFDKTRLKMRVPDTWDHYVEGGLRDVDPMAADLLDAGQLVPDVVAALRGDASAPKGAFRPRKQLSPLRLDDLVADIARRGFVRWSAPLPEARTVEQARAALSTLDALPEGYGVDENHWIVVDEKGTPRAVIDWGTSLMYHRPNGHEVSREQRLRRIASRRTDPALGHVVVEAGPHLQVKLEPRQRELVFEPLGPDQHLVMIDSSVMWSSMRAGVPPNVVIMFHTALAMDIIMAEYDNDLAEVQPKFATRRPSLFDGSMVSQDLPHEPVAPTSAELRRAARLMQADARLAEEQGRERRLTRTDAISAALAIAMHVPLLTRVPEIYEGLDRDGQLVVEDLGPEVGLGAT